MSLVIRRGLLIDRTSFTPDDGEPIWENDTKTLYIGDGSTPGGILIGGVSPVLDYFILRSTGTDAHRWKFTVDDSGMLSQPGQDLGV